MHRILHLNGRGSIASGWTMKVAVKVDRAEADCQATLPLVCIGTEAYCVYESITQTDMLRMNTYDGYSWSFQTPLHQRGLWSIWKVCLPLLEAGTGGVIRHTYIADLRRLICSMFMQIWRDRTINLRPNCSWSSRRCNSQEVTLNERFRLRKSSQHMPRNRGHVMTTLSDCHTRRSLRVTPRNDSRDENQGQNWADDDFRKQGMITLHDSYRFCSCQHPRGPSNCPAYGNICHECGK